ncbi:MAG: tetratricopeptide repeat protein [Acidobacteriaceae bacterium]|nr:tetratricopeptide repeat protein [Acidobacteriaceae bacterium]
MIHRFAAITLSLAALLTAQPAHTTAQAAHTQIPKPEGHAQQARSTGENEFSVSQTLFSTLAAINAAGYNAGLDSPLNQSFKLRQQVRDELAKRNIACLAQLKEFYAAHRKASSAADLGQYISFALVAGDAPGFELPSGELPPDVEPLRDFSGLLARFYKEANLKDLWNRSQQAYAAVISEYQDPVIDSLFEANGYLRNPSGYLGRRFQIYLDLLGAPDQVQVRSYRDDYFVVITPASTPVVDEIRDAYLAYILDPLSFKYSDAIKQKKTLQKYALDAPALDLAYKDDFSLLVTKCMIKAIDSRLLHTGAENRDAFVNEAMREGFILTAAFADFLPRYEKQPDAFKLYYPTLINDIDVKREEKRLKNIQFVQSMPPKVIAAPAKMEIDPAEAALESAEGLYEQGDYENARKTFKQVLEQTTDKSMQGRAYYGLARIAVHENKTDDAVALFERTAEFNPNPPITAWAHVYLGRLALAAGHPEKATDQFKAALAIDGASAMAREAAEKGLQTSSSTGDKQQ